MPAFSREEDLALLEIYRDLRVADVRDGMDFLLLHHYGSMSPETRPLFRTRTCGIARTVRYLPYEGGIPRLTPEEYRAWVDEYYGQICPYPWLETIREGDFIVIDQSGVDAGLMGSHNTLEGVKRGARGYVTNGGVRDTDEIIIQKIPFWCRFVSQKMVQGRLRFDAMDIPVEVNGVIVHPGDVVVADGDGVIVVPRAKALEVAEWAARELAKDKVNRRRLYEELGREPDETVK